MRRSGQPVIFLLCVGMSSLWLGNVWRTKLPVSVHLSEGAGLTPLPPVGRLGWGDSHPELQGSRTAFTHEIGRRQRAGCLISVVETLVTAISLLISYWTDRRETHSLTPHPADQARGEEVIYMLMYPVCPHKQASKSSLDWVHTEIVLGVNQDMLHYRL